MTAFSPHADYKHSGIPWFTQIPSHWHPVAVRHLSSRITDGAHVSPDIEGGPYPFISTRDLTASGIDFEGALTTSKESFDQLERHGCRPKPGDILFSKDGTIGRTAIVTDAREFVVASSLIIITPDLQQVDPVFLDFLFQSTPVQEQVRFFVKGTGLPRISIRNLNRITGLLPTLAEQHRIAQFLTVEVAQIDDLISKQERLIELLAEKRQAVITHAVTKGLNPSALTKPSGVPWLGDVPEHWSVRKFSQVTFISGGQVDPRVKPWASMLLIAPNHVESGTGKILYRESSADQGADSGKYFVKAGEVIYSKIRPYLRKVVIAPEDCLCSADMYGISAASGTMSNRFLQELMLSQPFTDFTRDSSARVAMPKINRESLAQGFLWYPPRNEQDQILAYIDRESELTARLQNRAKTFIELLRERRSALISAAVTGKINVQKGAA